MSSVQTAVAALIVVVIPVAFLLLIYYLDLYANCSLRLVAFCFVWGAFVGLGIAYGVNTYIALPLIKRFRLDYLLLYIVFAPLTEEIGIKRKLVEKAGDPKRTQHLKQEIARLEKDTKQRRKELDTCARAYLHYVFDNAPADIAPCLEGIVANIERRQAALAAAQQSLP